MTGKELSGLDQTAPESTSRVSRLKKIGWIGFLIFLVKGIVWLVIGYLIVKPG